MIRSLLRWPNVLNASYFCFWFLDDNKIVRENIANDVKKNREEEMKYIHSSMFLSSQFALAQFVVFLVSSAVCFVRTSGKIRCNCPCFMYYAQKCKVQWMDGIVCSLSVATINSVACTCRCSIYGAMASEWDDWYESYAHLLDMHSAHLGRELLFQVQRTSETNVWTAWNVYKRTNKGIGK